MNRTLTAILSLALCAVQARADGPPPPVGGFTFIEVLPTWTGFYFGGTGGYASSYFDMSVPATFAPSATPDGTGGVGGIVLGYNKQLAFLVGGLELDLMAGTLGTNKSFPSLVDTSSGNITTNFGTLASIRGRAGVAMGPVLLYGTAGGVWASVQSDIAVMNTGTLVARGVATADHYGWVAGAGAEIEVWPHWVIRGEFLHYGLDSRNYHYTGQFAVTTSPAPPFVGDTSVSAPSLNIGRAAIILKF